jgi:cytoskeleton protein RodZ
VSDETDSSRNSALAGKTLQKARTALGYSIQDVATATKISARVLGALENGETGSLPPKTFTRGFVRSYANFLKLDPQPLIVAFGLDDSFISNLGRPASTEHPSGTKTDGVTPTEPPIGTTDAKPLLDLRSRLVLSLTVLALIAVVLIGRLIVNRYAKERQPPAEVTTESGKKVLPAPVLPPTTAPSTGPSPSPTESVAAVASPTVVATPTATATPIPTPTKMPTPIPAPTPMPKPTAIPAPTKAPTPTPASAVKANLEIIVEALDAVELEAVLDSQTPVKVSLAAGGVRVFKAKTSVDLQVSDGGLVNIVKNGQDLGNPGDLGKKVRVKYP